MRRKDREITNVHDSIAIIARCKVCRLGLSRDNYPYIVPLNYGYTYTGGILTLFFHGAREGTKIDIMRKNPHVCFEIDCDHQLIEGSTASGYSYAYKSVMGFGTIYFAETNEEKTIGLNHLMRQQTGTETAHQYTEDTLNHVCVYKLVVEELTGKQRLPH